MAWVWERRGLPLAVSQTRLLVVSAKQQAATFTNAFSRGVRPPDLAETRGHRYDECPGTRSRGGRPSFGPGSRVGRRPRSRVVR
jgi:hypothetical protein